MWACGSDASKDVAYSKKIMQNYAQEYCKLRAVLRWCLSNLFDQKDLLRLKEQPKHLCQFDLFYMSKLHELNQEMKESFCSGIVANGYKALMHFVREFGTFVEVSKMRLYFEHKDSLPRRSAQFVVFNFFQLLVSYLTVTASFLAEESAQALWNQTDHTENEQYESVLTRPLYSLPETQAPQVDQWNTLFKLKSQMNQQIESQRQSKNLKSHDTFVKLVGMSELTFKCGDDYEFHAEDFFEAAKVSFESGSAAPKVCVAKSPLQKCPRCRRSTSNEEEKCCSYCLQKLS